MALGPDYIAPQKVAAFRVRSVWVWCRFELCPSCQQRGLLYWEWTRAHTCIGRYLRSCLFRCQRAVNPLHPGRGTITEGGSCGGLDLEPLGFIAHSFGSQPALSMTTPSTKRQNHMECQSFKTKETCAGHRKACLNEHFYTRSPSGVRAGSRV